eukprot:jgi/Bigna1/83848/fgenesh1_pg.116_\
MKSHPHESTPLLIATHPSRASDEKLPTGFLGEKGEDLPEIIAGEDISLSVFEEAWLIFKIGLPNVMQQLSGYGVTISSLVLVGRLAGPQQLGGIAVGSTFGSMVGSTILLGLSEGIDTLSSQAYGRKCYHLMLEILLRGIILLFIVASIDAAIFYNSEKIFLYLGQTVDMAKIASNYVRFLIPGTYGYALSLAFQRYLSAQGVTRPLWYVSGFTLPIHIMVTYYLVGVLKLGERGAAAAWSITHILRGLVLVIFTVQMKMSNSVVVQTNVCARLSSSSNNGYPAPTSPPQSKSGTVIIAAAASLRGWNQMLAISVPAVSMLACEFWAFEVLVLMAGTLPNPDVQVISMTIILNITALIFMFSSGVSMAVCVRVGANLGAGRGEGPKKILKAAIVVFLLQWLVVCIILLLPGIRTQLPLLFAPPSTTKAIVGGICFTMVVIQQLFDGLKEIMNGMLRGAGKQSLGLVTSIIAYFIICLPLAYVLAFKHFCHEQQENCFLPRGVPGLVLACTTASLIHAILNGCVIFIHINWLKEAQRLKSTNAT